MESRDRELCQVKETYGTVCVWKRKDRALYKVNKNRYIEHYEYIRDKRVYEVNEEQE